MMAERFGNGGAGLMVGRCRAKVLSVLPHWHGNFLGNVAIFLFITKTFCAK